MKRKSSSKKRKGKRKNPRGPLPPLVGTMLDIIEEVTFAFGTDDAAEESTNAPTLKRFNKFDQL